MALSVPVYVLAADIQDKAIRYRWDDWNEEQAVEPIDEEFRARLEAMSQRAILAFTAGTAEWIVHRFAVLSDDHLPGQYLEAAWAAMVDLRYLAATWEGYTNESAGWDGPVRRPLAMAMNQVDYIFEAIIEYDDPEISGALVTNLAQYILTDPAPFRIWRERVVQRLEIFFPLNPKDKLGEVVPREVLDPNVDFQPAQTESLINRFLVSLDYKTNPFLNSPEKMGDQGFLATPYVFEIEAEREARPRKEKQLEEVDEDHEDEYEEE